MLLAKVVLSLITMEPREAADLFPHSRQLKKICYRESRCSRIGIHDIDRRLGRTAWKKAVKVGILDPETCVFHRQREDMSEWSTSGPWGMIRAYSLRYLPEPCAPPEVLDIPYVAAYVASKRYKAAKRKSAPAALKRWARLIPLLSEQRRQAQPARRG